MATTVGVGACAGFLGSMVGLGGGLVAIPLLTGALKLTQHQAHGTSLAAVTATGAAGALSYGSVGSVDMVAAMAIAAGGMATAPLGARLANRMSQRKLQMALGGFQLAVAPLVCLKPYMTREKDTEENVKGAPTVQTEVSFSSLFPMTALGCCSGVLAGLLGVGGGTVVVPAVTFLTDHGHHAALGTSLAAMVLPSASGSLAHYSAGTLVPSVALPLAIGTAIGSSGGAQLASTIPEESLRYFFTVFMIFLGTRTLMKVK
eukprot:TRINITY_DN31015_c0_g1_i1.p1 TRINITY_DN31015_c0_g1~~TRINITY_DN31015_c0_g1_i1.p1  ORF type:complete len:274 (+),score=55.32 TRINITY_DN31015_c0_g1_i1:44-823(+)